MEQILRELTQKEAHLDLVLVSPGDHVGKEETCGHLGHRDGEEIEFKISAVEVPGKSQLWT